MTIVQQNQVDASVASASARLPHQGPSSLVALAAALLVAGLASSLTAEPAAQSSVRWQVRDIDCGAEIVAHRRGAAMRESPAADRLSVHAGYGTQALAYFQIPPARVISELKVTVPIRSDRVGLQALLHVVLPRTTDPKTGGPITVQVPGTSSQSTTEWETLVVGNITQELERRVRILQLSFATTIDLREAYVDMVLVNVYGGAGVTNVSLGDPHVEGVAAIPQHGLDGAAIHSVSYRSRDDEPVSAAVAKGGILYVRGRPLFVRMVDDNGEDWSLLKSLGINTVRLAAPVTFQQLATARKLGLWIVAPSPRAAMKSGLSRHFDRVIAWDLGEALTEAELTTTCQAARDLRDADRQATLPVVCAATCELGAYGACADILVHRRTIPCGTRQSNTDYGRWLRCRVNAARPSNVHWAAIETQPAAATIAQAQAIDPNCMPRLDAEEIRAAALTAATSGARGVYFRSRSRLDRPEPEDKIRQLAMRRTNLELEWIEPWLAAGRLQPAGIKGTRPSSRALCTDMSTLFLLRRDAAEAQSPLRLVIPDTSESLGVYRIRASGLVPVSHRRVAGGTQITGNPVDDNGAETVLLLAARDEAIVRHVARRINRTSSALADAIEQQLASEVNAEVRAGSVDASARQSYRDLQAAIARNDLPAAHTIGVSLLKLLHDARRREWQSARQSLPGPTACALATHTSTRQSLHDFLLSLPQAAQTVNLLDGGGCDDMAAMARAGWRTAVDQKRAAAQVAVTGHQPQSGKGCLRITAAWPENIGNRTVDDRALAWISAPPVTIGTGQVVRIAGWVKYRRAADDDPQAAGRLVIFDSLTGPGLGLRLQPTAGRDWQPFTIYRAAAESTELTVNFALTGPGTAHLDEISIAPVRTTNSPLGAGSR